ncbi:MAG TPA: hypothetical protein P5083_01515 [Candidatus Paceibacterota bacterium]|nr:hypothetical protein [Candidatus Paceibacterota bacterium]
MNEKTKKTLIILLIIIGIIGYFGYQYYKKEAPEEVVNTEKIESQKEIIIRELAKKYDALVDWDKNIRYTIQLQDLLVNSNKPILFTGSVDDVFIRDNQYYIRFRTGLEWKFSETQVYFVLKCDSNKALEIITQITKNNTDFGSLDLFSDNYIVIAEIENITKPILQISGYSEYESEEIKLEYEPSSTFIATGTCIDFVYIEDYIEEDDANKINELIDELNGAK